jgi:hypothetical protein
LNFLCISIGVLFGVVSGRHPLRIERVQKKKG